MVYNEFCEELKYSVQSIIGRGYVISLLDDNKLNGIIRNSIVIMKDGESVAPALYLEECYNDYLKGISLDVIAAGIINAYFNNYKSLDNIKVSLMGFKQVSDKIFFKLINYDKNIDYLKGLAHIRWMDLAITFSILIKNDLTGSASINIKNDMLDYWQVSIDTLMELAEQNTPKLFKANVKRMNDIIEEIIISQFKESGSTDIDDILKDLIISSNTLDNADNLYVATNVSGVNGAAWLLYNNELRNLSENLGSNLYILPSSIHEVIIVPSGKQMAKYDLFQMVKEVNETQVPYMEILSNNVYLYDYEKDHLTALF